MKRGETFTKNFINSFAHTTAGKFSKEKISGVHFYDPDRVRIIEKKSIDIKSGVYSAFIEVLNLETGQWIKKEELSTFFPDNWSIAQLFHECSFAFENKRKVFGNKYISETLSGVSVQFIINEDGKIITFYPKITNE